MEVAVERPPVKEEKGADSKPEIISAIGSALPIVFESFRSPQRTASIKQEGSSRMEAEMCEVREENERLKTMLSSIVSDYKTLQMQFLDVVRVREQAAKAKKLLPAEPAAPAPPPVADDDPDDLVYLSLGTRAKGGDHRKGHEMSSSSSGTADDSQLSLGLGFSRPSTDDEKASHASAGPVLNLSSDSNSADNTAKPTQTDACRPAESRKSPSGGAGAGAGDGADDEVQQQAKKTRVSVRVKCDTPTMNDGCQWRKYGQKISKGNPCPRAYYRCTVAPNCPVRKQVQRCAEDRSILITTYEGTHNHQLPPAATAMASTTSAAAAMLTTGSTSSTTPASLVGRHHLPLASSAGLLRPTTMVSTVASCPTVTLDLTASAANPHSLMHAFPYAAAAAGYESKALPAAWSSGYPAYGGSQSQPSYFATKSSPAMGHLFAGLGVSTRPDQQYGRSSYLQWSSSPGGGGGQSAAVAPVMTDTLARAITSDPSFQSVLAAVITSYMGRGGGETAQK